jgi:hypothetical protein
MPNEGAQVSLRSAVAGDASAKTRPQGSQTPARAIVAADLAEKCLEIAVAGYRAKTGKDPFWMPRDTTVPLAELCAIPGLTVEDFAERWRNYLDSTEDFTRKMGFSLKFFCAHFGEFATGPKRPPEPPKTFDQLRNERSDDAIRNFASKALAAAGPVPRLPAGARRGNNCGLRESLPRSERQRAVPSDRHNDSNLEQGNAESGYSAEVAARKAALELDLGRVAKMHSL